MLRNIILGVTAAALLVAIGATAVTAGFAPENAAPYGQMQANRTAYDKGAMLKNCTGSQGECALIVN